MGFSPICTIHGRSGTLSVRGLIERCLLDRGGKGAKNMDPKPGYKTTEFWLTAVGNIAGAVLAILAARGLITDEESNLYLQLVEALAVAVIPLALAAVNFAYIKSRQQVKTSAILAKARIQNK
jgi:hypothetical protein